MHWKSYNFLALLLFLISVLVIARDVVLLNYIRPLIINIYIFMYMTLYLYIVSNTQSEYKIPIQ